MGSMGIVYNEQESIFHLFNKNMSYIIALAGGKYPLHLYWGKRVRTINDNITARITGWITGYPQKEMTLDWFTLDNLPQECPVFGVSDLREGMLHVRQEDGTHALDLCYEGYQILDGKPDLPGLPHAKGTLITGEVTAKTLRLLLRDSMSGVRVELDYTLYEDLDILVRSARIQAGSAPITLEQAYSASVDFPDFDGELLTLSGAWLRERQIVKRPVVPGKQGVSTARGASSIQTSPFMALMEKGAGEDNGNVFAFALCYSGSFDASVDMDQYNTARARIGIQPYNFSWKLEPGEQFQTPEAYLCYSSTGLSGMSLQFHTLLREYITRGEWAKTERPILINNWEATYFAFNEEKILSLAACAKEHGIEMFVLDDGWFGHRDTDTCSLGDWMENPSKLPHGLEGLSEKLHGMGMKFGIWMEPEMVSPDSDLYRAHPDWCIHAGERPRVEYRSQLVLDLSRRDVQDYIIAAVCDVLARGKIDYLKWDMNRNISCWGSEELPPERQKEQGHRYILGLYRILGEITGKYPHVLFESCASGGGRFDFGMMYYMPQAWCSDNTDVWMRCRIQHATSLVFPPSTMGAHVSAVPNHQTGNVTPLLARAHVAMGGTYGYELDIERMPSEELDKISELNKQVRKDQKLLLYGSYYRLCSPFDGNEAAFMSVSPDRQLAVVTHVYEQGKPFMSTHPALLKLKGLDPEADYKDLDSGKVYGGDALMYYGIPLDRPVGYCSSQQFHLQAVAR